MNDAPAPIETAALAGGWDPIGPAYIDDDLELAWIDPSGSVVTAQLCPPPPGAWWAIRRSPSEERNTQ